MKTIGARNDLDITICEASTIRRAMAIRKAVRPAGQGPAPPVIDGLGY